MLHANNRLLGQTEALSHDLYHFQKAPVLVQLGDVLETDLEYPPAYGKTTVK
jgi:hypothetical protein